MDKILDESLAELNIQKLRELFPNIVSDGGGIDFEILRSLLGSEIDASPEKFQFTWNGKINSIKFSQLPSTGTLRPSPSESKDWKCTKNTYIEGDNLEVLKLLQKTYTNKVKMIYIDPPYNTGGDFVYRDNYTDSLSNYKLQTQQSAKSNPETSGRFHTEWLNMIYPRILLARNLLSEDGILFASIDDSEQKNLKNICDEIFGEGNFIAQIIIEGTPKNDPYIVSTAHEYCLVYVKNFESAKTASWGLNNPIYSQIMEIFKSSDDCMIVEKKLKEFYMKNDLINDNMSNYKYADKNGVFRIGPIDDPQRGGSRDVRINPITGENLKTPTRGWGCSLETWEKWTNQNLIMFPKSNDQLCAKKTYISEDKLDLLRSYIKIQTRRDTQMLENMFGSKVFSFPKPVELIKTFIDSSIKGDEIVLDFFAGSSTTAHALFLKNAEDNVKRNFILVQLPENLDENLKTVTGNREKQVLNNAIEFCKKNGYPNFLTEIGKERIRRAGDEIVGDLKNKQDKLGLLNGDILDPALLDIGFKVFKLDSSNFIPFKSTKEGIQASLSLETKDNSRSELDIVYEVMLKYGIFDQPISEVKVDGKNAYSVGMGYMIVCLDKSITDVTISEIAKLRPKTVIFDEVGFIDDNAKENAIYTLKRSGVEEIKSI